MGKGSVAETDESIFCDLKTVMFKDLNLEDMLSNNALVGKNIKDVREKDEYFWGNILPRRIAT
jgi:hypothetical protein